MASIKKNFGFQLAYRILNVVTPLITSPIVSRALGAEKLGVYSATHAMVNYFMIFALLGIEKYGQRTIAAAQTKEEKQQTFWEIYTVQFLASLICTLAYFGYAFFGDRERLQVIFLQGIWMFSCLLNINWFFYGCEDFKVTVVKCFVIKLITVIAVVFFIRTPEDLPLYTFILAGSTVLSEFVLWFNLRARIHFQKPDFTRVRMHMAPILKLFIPVIALSLYHIMDKTMLDVMSTEAEVGYYYSADKIIYIPLGLITAIGTVMLPRMSYILKNKSLETARAMLGKSVELTMFLTSAVGFGIASVAREFVPLFFGKGYDRCVQLLYVFIPVLLVKGLGDVVRSQFLIPSGMDNQYTLAVIGGAITNIIFNIIFIPMLGALGAVVGTLAAESAVLVIQTFCCRKQVHFVLSFLKQSIYLIPGALMFIIVRLTALIPGLHGILQLAVMVGIGASFYGLLSLLLWMVVKDSMFRTYLRKIPVLNRILK